MNLYKLRAVALAGIGVAGVTAAVVAFAVTTAFATQSASFSFTTDPDVGISGPPGSLKHVGSLAVPTSMQGLDCTVTVDVANNESRREGTDLLVSSNQVNLELLNVEHAAGNAPPQNLGTLKLGPFVNAWVRFGPVGEASVDAAIHVTCPDEPEVCLLPEGCDEPVVGPPAETVVKPATPLVAAAVFTG